MSSVLRERAKHDPVETALRRDLAACYRLAAHFGWDDLLANHFSVRVPGRQDGFLLNPYGLLFEEVTASSLVKIDMDGNILEASDYDVNRAGFVIHSAIHQARPEVACVMHLHTRDGVAVSSTEAGILPLNQTAAQIYRDVAFHEFEGIATDLGERARLQSDLGERNFMILRNHGTLTVGQSIAGAFYRMYLLEWVCNAQVRTLSMNAAIHPTPKAALDKVNAQLDVASKEKFAIKKVWPAMLRKCERLFPGFAD